MILEVGKIITEGFYKDILGNTCLFLQLGKEVFIFKSTNVGVYDAILYVGSSESNFSIIRVNEFYCSPTGEFRDIVFPSWVQDFFELASGKKSITETVNTIKTNKRPVKV
jgi:hypothetical protein